MQILPEDNAGTVHDKLMMAGAELLVKTVKGLADGTLKEIPQADVIRGYIHHAPKLFREMMQIDWSRSVSAINNFIRGLSPYPAAHTVLGNKQLKVFRTHYTAEQHNANPGTYDTDHSTYLRFAAADGWVYADELQLEGKKRMGVVEFLRGFRGV